MNNMNQITQNNIITILEENDMNVSNQKMEFNNNINNNNIILNNINESKINNHEKSREKNFDNNSKSNNQCAGSNSKYFILYKYF